MPRRARLTLHRVVSATVSLIDERGVPLTSMRAVAEWVGVEPQSLYTFVDSRGTLLDAVVEQLFHELDDDPGVRSFAGEPWRPYLTGLAHGVRRLALNHPRAFPLLAARPAAARWMSPPMLSLRWTESLLANLRESDFSDDQVLFAYRSFNIFCSAT